MYQMAVIVGSDHSMIQRGSAQQNAQANVNAWLAQHPDIAIIEHQTAAGANGDIVITILYKPVHPF